MTLLRLPKPGAKSSDASWVLLLFVLLSLFALAIVPVLGDRHVGPMQTQLRAVAEPARGLVTEIQLVLATGGAAARDLIDTGDSVFLQRYETALAEERRAYQQLEPLVARLGEPTVARYRELRTLEARWHDHLAGLVQRPASGRDAAARSEELDLYEQTLIAAARLDDAISRRASQIRVGIIEAERLILSLTIGLVALAAGAAVVVAHLGRRLRRYAQTTEQQRAALEEVLQSKERLMGGITHDLKNPLNAIDGYAQLLQQGISGPLTPTQQQNIVRIRKSVASLLELIHTLLELARTESGHLKITREPVDLREVVQDVLEQHRLAAEAQGLVLAFERDGSLRPVVTDRARVTQILANLIGNAVKYTGRQNHGKVTVRLGSGVAGPRAGKWVAITVADTGPGIPPDFRERVFQEFARASTSTEGVGLGLAVSRRLARLLGGEITFESEPGQGATFTLWLPMSGTSELG